MESKKIKKALIVEGGGFKTSFTTGILDAFLNHEHNPFDSYYGVSGGTIAISYFLSEQKESCYHSLLLLSKSNTFTQFKRLFHSKGIMDIEFLRNVATELMPFEVEKAMKNSSGKEVYFVATNRLTGEKVYFNPTIDLWLDQVIASSTLPFVTKGVHLINNTPYFDGGWADPLPVKKAYEDGVREITLLRTWPSSRIATKSWPNFLGSKLNKSKVLRGVYADAHNKYNACVDFINNPPEDLVIKQIAPAQLLKNGVYQYTKQTIMEDYAYGFSMGNKFIEDLA